MHLPSFIQSLGVILTAIDTLHLWAAMLTSPEAAQKSRDAQRGLKPSKQGKQCSKAISKDIYGVVVAWSKIEKVAALKSTVKQGQVYTTRLVVNRVSKHYMTCRDC